MINDTVRYCLSECQWRHFRSEILGDLLFMVVAILIIWLVGYLMRPAGIQRPFLEPVSPKGPILLNAPSSQETR